MKPFLQEITMNSELSTCSNTKIVTALNKSKYYISLLQTIENNIDDSDCDPNNRVSTSLKSGGTSTSSSSLSNGRFSNNFFSSDSSANSLDDETENTFSFVSPTGSVV